MLHLRKKKHLTFNLTFKSNLAFLQCFLLRILNYDTSYGRHMLNVSLNILIYQSCH